ncbi:MAG: DUF6514 family protein [Defluviitaleaceae bacterium]|nr:DUF6514 family protein [Defluviitaleaceae bacterium]
MKKAIATAKVHDFEVRYHKTTQLNEEGEKFYGIHAVKYEKGVSVEESETGGISSDEHYVENIIDMISKNEVTPQVLCEVLDEIVS